VNKCDLPRQVKNLKASQKTLKNPHKKKTMLGELNDRLKKFGNRFTQKNRPDVGDDWETSSGGRASGKNFNPDEWLAQQSSERDFKKSFDPNKWLAQQLNKK